MSVLARYFYGCDDGKKKKGIEVVNDEDDDVGSSVCLLRSSQCAYDVFYVCLLSEGACWRISTLHSCLLSPVYHCRSSETISVTTTAAKTGKNN